jgi:hypothetical protein
MEPKPKFAGSWRTDKEPNGPWYLGTEIW